MKIRLKTLVMEIQNKTKRSLHYSNFYRTDFKMFKTIVNVYSTIFFVCLTFSTPMMDLLVQVTTANKISPGGHVIQALGERGVLPYKPSTPIGKCRI